MPMTFTKGLTPQGRPYGRVFSSGEVTPEDAEAGAKQWAPGGEYANTALLAVVDPSAKYSPEARQIFTKGQANGTQPIAIVVSNTPTRVMLSFVVRAMGASPTTRFFKTEAEGLAFIDASLG